ncbi:MAG: PAS domain-containing protein [Chloroflexales bacterium]|nr:PAS domain-containing protein [Chloroflexales bacterium]
MLAEFDRAKTAFFNNISHEFRTPLMLLLAPAEDALADPELPSGQHERIVLIHRNALRLQKLVNSQLDFSRIEAHRIEATYIATDLATLTAELAGMFRSAVERARLRLRIDCPLLPEPVYVDRDMWEKIVFNLLSNALKFTLTGEIMVSLRSRETDIELTVRDTGIGIPAAELPQLFERFHRIGGARGHSFEGTGIGLALVQELVRLHGGTVQVESVVDQGSVFTVNVPGGASHLPPDRIVSPSALTPMAPQVNPYVEGLLGWLPGEATSAPLPAPIQSTPLAPEAASHSVATPTRPRILLADDNADIRAYVQRLLSSQYTVETVADGAAALAAAHDFLPDLIIADVMMPHLDGFGLIKELRSDPRTRTTPIILLSARVDEEARVEGLAVGADDYLSKPFGTRELLAHVNGTLALAKVRREAVEALAARETQLREAQRLAHLGSWEWDLATDTVTWSDELYRIWGVNPQAFEATYEAVRQLVHPNDRALFEHQIATATRTHAPYSFEHRIIRPDGEMRIMHSRGAVVVSDGGEAARMVGTAQDITERKQTEAELEASRLLFQRIAETSPDMLYVYDLTAGRIVYISVRSEQVIGYTPDQVIDLGDQFAISLWHADDIAALPKHYRTLRELDDNDIYEIEYRLRQPDGSYRWLRSRASVFTRAENGHVQQLIGVTQDVTTYKLSEEALRQTEERFRRYFELGLIGMAITSPGKGIIEVNDELCTLLGYERHELLQLTWAALTHPDDLTADMAQFEAMLAGQIDGYMLDKRWIRRDGQVIDATISVRCVRRPDGTVDYCVALLQDVTERKQAEADLVELKNRLASDLAAMTNLHHLGAQLLATSELEPLLSEALSAIIALQGAGFGKIQLYNQQRGRLEIIVQQGFDQVFVEHFSTVDDEHSASGRAMLRRERVIIEDVETDAGFAPHRAIAAATGFRAVQSTPLYDRAGTLLGVVSTHFRQPHRPTEHMLRLTDLYTRQIAEIIGFKQAQEQLRQAHDELEAKVEARTQQLADANAILVVENDERRRAEQARRRLVQQLVSAQEEERRRISRELHDSLGQYLTALNIGLKSMENQTGHTDRTASGIRQLHQLVALLDDAVDRIAFELRPPRLDDLGLDAALHLLAKEWSATSGIQVDIVTNGLSRQRIPATTETTLYRVVQEALTNILKHAQASRVSLIAERRNGEVRVIIEDDGRGFDLAAVVAAPETQRKLGLRGMEERAALAGGQIEIETAPGKGTTIYISIPLPLEHEGWAEHG